MGNPALPDVVFFFLVSPEIESAVGSYYYKVHSQFVVFEHGFNPYLLEVEDSFGNDILLMLTFSFVVLKHFAFENKVPLLP